MIVDSQTDHNMHTIIDDFFYDNHKKLLKHKVMETAHRLETCI
jgi:hypothetical protein